MFMMLFLVLECEENMRYAVGGSHDSLVGHQTPSSLSTLVPINSEQSLAQCLGAAQQLEISLYHDLDNSPPPRAFLVSHIFVSS